MMKTLIAPSTEAVSDMLSSASTAQLSENHSSTKDRLLATLQALPPKAPTPKDPAIAALLQSLNASTKFRQRANGNRRARRSIRVKRMYPKGYLRQQKHAKGFGWKLTQTTDHPNHPHHPHHSNDPDDSKVLRSHAAQTAIDRYTNAASLGDALQPTFTQIASTLPTGSAPADLSMGRDGTLWAIDEQGAPHIYDPINDEWNVHGEGIDAAAAIGETLYLFRGNQYVTVNCSTQQTSAPLPITSIATDPNNPLPRSFQLGVSGAAAVGNTLYLFHGGWYLSGDGTQRDQLTKIDQWPMNDPNWANGLVDAVFTQPNKPGVITLRHGAECIDLEVSGGTLQLSNPSNPSYSVPPQFANIDAGVFAETHSYNYTDVQVVIDQNPPQYIPTLHQNWPTTWNPVLTHAPSGRMGNLWVATTAGDTIQHNGETWSSVESPTGFQGTVNSISVGIDGSVWLANGQALASWNSNSWTQYPTLGTGIHQVSVGDASRVWVRDGQNNVMQYDSQSQQYNSLNGQSVQAIHIGANNDGTLWHCSDDSQHKSSAYRLVSESTAPSEQLPVNTAVTSVQRVATTGFGSSHCLAQHSDGSQGIYRYDSPYVFKTSEAYPGTFQIVSGLGRLYVVRYVNEDDSNILICALDMHTGEELASCKISAEYDYKVGDNIPVFDPINELVYFYYPDEIQGSTLLALDAYTLATRWSFSLDPEKI